MIEARARTGAWLLALMLVVGGCGGDEGGEGGALRVVAGPPPSSSMPSSTLAPISTLAPAPSAAVLPPAPFGIAVDQRFELFGWTYRDGSREPAPIASGDAALSWSSARGVYEFTLAGIGTGTLRYNFQGRNPYAFSLVDDHADVLPVTITLQPGNFFDPAYRATGLLSWTRQGASRPSGVVAFGLPASPSDASAVGRLRYLSGGGGHGGGDAIADLTFDFAAGTLGGNVRVAWVDAWGPYQPARYDITDGVYDRGTTSFSARFAVPGAPSAGSLYGRFFGPGAGELVIWWRAPVRNPYTGEWTIASDVIAGKAYCAFFINAPCDDG